MTIFKREIYILNFKLIENGGEIVIFNKIDVIFTQIQELFLK